MEVGDWSTVETTNGSVRGVRYAGVGEYLGIPYGGDVDGSARFGPPTPAPTWTGVHDATVYGAGAPQADPRVGATAVYTRVLEGLFPGTARPLEARPQSENCLVLNVWAPASALEAGAPPVPVMVWLHGGGFVHGTGAEGWSHGANLARHGDVVVVKVNHRLGLLGFMPTGDGIDQRSGVAGMLDIVQALEWVRDNAAAFGGDPSNVTVFGQSGGAMKVSTLLGMPAARPLFHRAVMQSGPGTTVGTDEIADRVLAAVCTALDIDTRDTKRLLDVPASALIDVQSRLAEIDPAVGAMGVRPFRTPDILPGNIADPDFHDDVARVPLLIGRTTHEIAFMMAADPGFHALTDELLPAAFSARFGDVGDELFEHYRTTEDVPQLVLARALTDQMFVKPTIEILRAKSRQEAAVFSYRYDYRPQVFDGVLGAHHTLAIPFAFGNMSYTGLVGENPDRHDLSAAMLGAWSRYAATGVPESDRLPTWQPWTAESPNTMVLNPAPELERDRELPAVFDSMPSLF